MNAFVAVAYHWLIEWLTQLNESLTDLISIRNPDRICFTLKFSFFRNIETVPLLRRVFSLKNGIPCIKPFCRFTVACHKCNFRIEKELCALHLHHTQTKHSKYWHRHQQATAAPSYAQSECKYSWHGLVSTSIRRSGTEDGSSQRRHNIFCATPFGSSFNLYRYFAFEMNWSDIWADWAWCDFYFLAPSLET